MARPVRTEPKFCTGCRQTLPLDQFRKAAGRNYVEWRCKPCQVLYDKENRIKRGPRYILWAAAKHRAKINNLPFNIEIDDILVPVYCPVLGIKLNFNKGKQASDSASLDRIINDQGYVKGNIQIISLKANRMKNDATLEELKALVAYLEELA